jgi:hydrogenase maturation protease
VCSEAASHTHRPVRVLGLGNVLLGDDALGPYAVATAGAELEVGEGVELVDLGTPGLDLLPYLSGARAVVVVDTVRANGPPGELRIWHTPELLSAPTGPRVGPHDPGLLDALTCVQLDGSGPEEVVLVGVIPERTTTGVGLSAAVRAAVPAAVAAVAAELERLGVTVSRKRDPQPPDLWWEQ